MFETFYEFTNTPFSRDIATDQLYSSIMLEETLGRLEYAAKRQLFAVVTGDCGTGKTTIIRKFKDYLDSAQFMVMYLADSQLTPGISTRVCWSSWDVKPNSIGVMPNASCTVKLSLCEPCITYSR